MLPDWANDPNTDELLKSTDRALMVEEKTFLVLKRIKMGLRRGIFLAGAAQLCTQWFLSVGKWDLFSNNGVAD